MNGRKSRVLTMAGILLVGALSLESLARAETAVPSSQVRPAIVINQQQLDEFAELVGEPSPVVWQRMLDDPRIVPLAITAADTRTRRERSARALFVFGFISIGIGVPTALLGGAALGLTSSSTNGLDPSDKILGVTMLAVALVATVGGAAMAIAGNKKGREKTGVETAAYEQYRSLNAGRVPVLPLPLSANRPNGLGTNTVGIPVLSLSF